MNKLVKLLSILVLTFASAAANAASFTLGNTGLLAGGTATYNINSAGAGLGFLNFDLIGYGSIDGVNCCTDTFSITINGDLVYQANFNLGGGGADNVITNTYGASHTITLGGYPMGVWNGGVAKISLNAFPILNGANSIAFSYGVLQGLGDEAWEIANGTLNTEVSQVTQTPLPAAAWLFGSALFGAAGFGARRKTKLA